MADDFNKLAVLIEANTKSYERAMAKLQSSTNEAFGKIQRQSQRLDSTFSRMSGSIGRIGAALAAGLSIGSAVRFADAFTRIENSLKVAGLAGTELADVQERLFQIAQKNGTSFESLASLYGKLALSQSALGVSTSELVGFTDTIGTALRVSGVSAEQASGALLQLGQALGSGTVRAEEFNSILEGAPAIAQAAAAGLEEAGGSVAKLRALVNEGAISSQAFFRSIEAGSTMLESRAANAVDTTSQAMQRLQNAMTRFVGEADHATGASSGVAWALDGMTKALQDASDWLEQNRHKFRDWTDDVRDSYVAVEEWAARVRKSLGVSDFLDRTIGTVGDGAIWETPNPYPANISRKGMGGRVFDRNRNRINQAFEDARGVRKVSLSDFPGLSSGSSTSATSFDQVARAASKATTETRNFENVIESVEEKTNATAEALSGFASSFAGDMLRGANAADSMRDALGRIADQLINTGLNAALAGLFGNRGGYFGAGGFTNTLAFGGPRAMGGPVSAGKGYLVGERGPELFVPSTAGAIRSNDAGAVNVQVFNNNAGQSSVSTEGSGRPGDPLRIVIDAVKNDMAKNGFGAGAESRYGLRRQTRAR